MPVPPVTYDPEYDKQQQIAGAASQPAGTSGEGYSTQFPVYDGTKLNPANTSVNGVGIDQFPNNSPEYKGLTNYIGGKPNLNVSGNPVQVNGSIEGLNRGNLLYGQDMMQTGHQIQTAVGKYTDRMNGTDPVTEALKQQKQQSQANMAHNLAGRGVAGVAAGNAIEQAGRQKDIDIAASAYQQNQQNLKDYTNLVSNIGANQGTLEQLYRGNAVAGVQLQPVQNQSGLLSSLFG